MKRAFLATLAVTAMTGLLPVGSSIAQNQTPASKSQPPAQSGTTSAPGKEQPGVQRVEGASVVMTFYAADAADFRASKILGQNVYNLQNESIGEVNDLIISDGKTIKAIVIGVGGFLGIGERNVAVAPASLVLSEQQDGSARLVVNTNREDLKNAPAFNFADVDKAGPGTSTTGSGATRK